MNLRPQNDTDSDNEPETNRCGPRAMRIERGIEDGLYASGRPWEIHHPEVIRRAYTPTT
jgi:hypothetical protein